MIFRKKYISLVSVLGVLATMNVFFGNGCGNSMSAKNDGGSSSGVTKDLNAIEIIPGTKMVSTVYSRQALDHLTSCAGVEVPSDASVSMYESKKGAISVYGMADTMTSPMMMAIISISGEVCNDLIAQEKAMGTKRIFKDWDLNSTNLPTSAQINESIARLSLSCWDRAETSEERTYLNDIVYSVANGEAQASEKAALVLCTGVLSSLNSLLN